MAHETYIVSHTNQKLTRINQELETFVYVASHDLQEPLRMVGNFVQLLEEEYYEQVGEEGKMYINFAVDGVRRMSKLIDDFLEYSRAGRGEVKKELLDLTKIIDQKLLDLSLKIKEKNAKITIEANAKMIFADPRSIGVVMQNLLLNALKFTTSPQPTVHIGISSRGRETLITVADNGIGIPLEHQDKIFEAFKRLHRKEEYEGTGIGLALVKRIVEKHGGKIWLKSKVGEGTIFYISLPNNP